MQSIDWLWNELRDIYRPPETYICRKPHYKWMAYTSFFVESLREFVSERNGSVQNSICVFQRKISKLRDLDMARAGFAVAKAALEIWRESGRERRIDDYNYRRP